MRPIASEHWTGHRGEVGDRGPKGKRRAIFFWGGAGFVKVTPNPPPKKEGGVFFVVKVI